MDKFNLYAVAILLLIGIGLIAYLHILPNMTFDDYDYILFAHQMLNGTFNQLQSPYAYGTGLIAVYALALTISNSVTSIAIINSLAFFGLILMLYIIVKDYFNKEVALVTAICMELSAFIVPYATRALPEMWIGLIYAIVFYLFYKAKNRPYLMLLGGLLAAFSTFFIFSGAAYGLILIFTILLIKRQPKQAGLFAIGFIAMLLLYMALLPVPLSQAPATFIHQAVVYMTNQANESFATIGSQLYTFSTFFIGTANTSNIQQVYYLGAVSLFVIIGSIVAWIKGDKDMKYQSATFWLAMLYLMIGTVSVLNYTMMTVVDRYFILFAVPMALLSAYTISWIMSVANKANRRDIKIVIYIAIIMLVFLTNFYTLYLFHLNPQPKYYGAPLCGINIVCK